MLGAIAGDIIGSVFEFDNHRSTDFPLFAERNFFTDDSILTVAVAGWVLNGGDLVDAFHDSFDRYPGGGWGGMFYRWCNERRREPYGSFGNGSAMRVSPVGWAFDDEATVLREAEHSAAVTHSHPRGIAGAQVVALAILMARQGASREAILEMADTRFAFRCNESVAELQLTNEFDETCDGTIPAALQVFAESKDFEHAIRLAVSIGGDTDTIAAIVGSIAEAYYGGVPEAIATEVLSRLDEHLLQTVEAFRARYSS